MAHLFSRLKVRNRELRNRIVLPPMANSMATARGEVTDTHLDHYVRRAGAGVGMVIVEHAFVRPDGRASERQLAIDDDSLIPGLRRLAEAVSACGTVVGVQITHAGGKAPSELTGRQALSAADGTVPGAAEEARAASPDELMEIAQAFAAAALRVQQAGYDFVEIHGAHGYLLSQILSHVCPPTLFRGGDRKDGARVGGPEQIDDQFPGLRVGYTANGVGEAATRNILAWFL